MGEKWGYIYCATTHSFAKSGMFKIGFTSNIPHRMDQLSNSTNMPDDFYVRSWFKFKTIEDARKVEKEAHKQLQAVGIRVNKKREFFYNPPFRSIVQTIAEQLGILTLSNRQLSLEMLEPLGIWLPCRYFYFHDVEKFNFYTQIVGESCEVFNNTFTQSETNLLTDGWLSFGLIEPEVGGFEEYLQLHDKTPYILSRIMFDQKNPLNEWASEQMSNYKEDLDEYFSYNKNWRNEIK